MVVMVLVVAFYSLPIRNCVLHEWKHGWCFCTDPSINTNTSNWVGCAAQLQPPAFWRYFFFLFSNLSLQSQTFFMLLLSGLSNVPQSSGLSVCRCAHRWHDGPLTGNKPQGATMRSYQMGCTRRDKTSVVQESAHQAAPEFSAGSCTFEVIISRLHGNTLTFAGTLIANCAKRVSKGHLL